MIACTRMYDVNPTVGELWRELLGRVADRAGAALKVIDHAAPAPLAELWARGDMGCVFMCGWPFRRADPRPRIVAAPEPIGAGCPGPAYRTDLVVRADSAHRRLEDTFGGRIAWTDEDSHSGFNAPRHHLAGLLRGRTALYRASVGPLVTPRASLLSVIEGGADVAPLDSYFHALLRRHEPALAAEVRTVARTACAPIPPLVASSGVPADAVERLGRALVSAADDDASRPLLEALCLRGFVAVCDPEVYELTERWDEAACAAGYPRPA